MPTSTSSTPQSSQDIKEELLELDQEQLHREGDGTTGVPPGVSGMSDLGASPAACLRGPSPLPLSTNSDEVPDDPNFDDQVLDQVMKTPSKPIKRKLAITPSSSAMSSAPSPDTSHKTGESKSHDKRQKRLLPSPGKRWLAEVSEEINNTQSETIEDIAEMVALGEVCHGPVKVCLLEQKDFFTEFRTDLNINEFRTDLNFTELITDLNFTKFRTDLNLTKFRTDLNFTKFRTDLNLTKFRTDLDFTKHRTDLNLTKFRTDLNLTKFRTDINFT